MNTVREVRLNPGISPMCGVLLYLIIKYGLQIHFSLYDMYCFVSNKFLKLVMLK